MKDSGREAEVCTHKPGLITVELGREEERQEGCGGENKPE